MLVYHRFVKFLLIQLFLLPILIPTTVLADYSPENTFVGMKYTIYLYNTEEASTTISFRENMSLLIDVYDGFGLYLPIDNLFIGLYWAPKYQDEYDLFLILNGMIVSEFIVGWGLTFPHYRFKSIFLFFGYGE